MTLQCCGPLCWGGLTRSSFLSNVALLCLCLSESSDLDGKVAGRPISAIWSSRQCSSSSSSSSFPHLLTELLWVKLIRKCITKSDISKINLLSLRFKFSLNLSKIAYFVLFVSFRVRWSSWNCSGNECISSRHYRGYWKDVNPNLFCWRLCQVTLFFWSVEVGLYFVSFRVTRCEWGCSDS